METVPQNEQAEPQEPAAADLWVLEGIIETPIGLPQLGNGPFHGKKVRGFFIDFSSGNGDGFVEIHASDVTRANTSSWWSKDEPIYFDFRCSVVASDPVNAWERANDFIEQVLNRLTFLESVPATLVSSSRLYNETELIACKAGTRSSFRFRAGGMPTSITEPIRNLHLIQHLRPSDRAKLAMRWFRKALTFEKVEDQFLAFFVALEVISDDIKSASPIKQTCKNCGTEVSSFTSHLEGFKDVVKRHTELSTNTFKILREIRGKIAHGNLSEQLTADVKEFLPLMEQLATEAITISIGDDPKNIKSRDGLQIYNCFIFGEINFNPEQNPHKRWGKSILEALTIFKMSSSAVTSAIDKGL